MKKGTRVRVNERITPGFGHAPKPGTQGTVEEMREDGTVLILFDDSRRAILAPGEVDSLDNVN